MTHTPTQQGIRHGQSLRMVALVFGVALILAACSGQKDLPLRVGNGTEPQALDPHVVTGVPEHHLLSTLFEGLVDADPKTLAPIPAVAETWEISADKTVYTFHLRADACWSNGDAVTAHDFVYSWRRMLTPGLAAEYSYLLHCIKNAREYNEGELTDFGQVGAEAVDDRTLRVTLGNPTPYFLSMQIHDAWFPVHQATVEKFGRFDERNTKWTRPGNLVGNGAFALKRWIPNNVIEVVKNERYWNAANVRLKRILFYPIDNQLTEERSFRTGLLDMTDSAPLAKVPVYRRERPELIHIDPYLGTYFYRVNVTRPPLDDVRVRRALAMALDRAAITANVLTGGQQPAHALCVPDTAGYTCRAQIREDAAEAKKLLADAGFPNGKGFPSIELLYNTSESHKLIAEAIQRMWKETLGIEVSLVNQDWKVYLASQTNLDYDVCRASWVGDVVDPVNFLECFTTSNGNNRTGWSSAAYDDLIARSRSIPDDQERLELFQKAESVLLEEVPIIPIYYYTRVFMKSPRVLGWNSNLLGYISFKSLYLAEERP